MLATSTSGVLISKLGPYLPPLYAGALLAVAGAALLTTLRPDSPPARWAGYQVAYGLGLGLCFQVPNVASQTVLAAADVPVGTALIMFAQLLGGAVFVAVGQSVLASELGKRLEGAVGFDARLLKEAGVTTLLAGLKEREREVAVAAYNEALRRTFCVGLAMTCCAVLAGSFMEWRSVKEGKEDHDRRVEEDDRGREGAESKVVGSVLEGGRETTTESEKETEGKTRSAAS